MSLIYKHPSGGCIHQCGAMEIPLKLRMYPFSLVVLSAREYQPKENPAEALQAVERIYVPLDDNSKLTGKEFRDTVYYAAKAAKHVAEKVSQGKNALVTCWAGLNRSGLISGLAIKNLTNLSGEQVTQLIKKRRSRWALSNPLFEEVVCRI